MAWGATWSRCRRGTPGWDAAVSLRSPDEVFALLAGVVGLDGGLEPFGCASGELSPTRQLHGCARRPLRRASLHSMLLHGAPSDKCTVDRRDGTLARRDAGGLPLGAQHARQVMPRTGLRAPARRRLRLRGARGPHRSGRFSTAPQPTRVTWRLPGRRRRDRGVRRLVARVESAAVAVHGMVEGGAPRAETVLMAAMHGASGSSRSGRSGAARLPGHGAGRDAGASNRGGRRFPAPGWATALRRVAWGGRQMDPPTG